MQLKAYDILRLRLSFPFPHRSSFHHVNRGYAQKAIKARLLPSRKLTASDNIRQFYKKHRDNELMEVYWSDKYEPPELGMLFNTDSTSTLSKDKGSIGHLPTGHPFRFHSYDMLPCSMIRKSFYEEHILGKTLPWLNSTFLSFGSDCIIPYSQDYPLMVQSIPHNRRIIDFLDLTNVHGLGLLPFIFGGIPCLTQVLIVDDIFPNQPFEVNSSRFDVVFDSAAVFDELRNTIPQIRRNSQGTIVFNSKLDGTAVVDIQSVPRRKRVLSVWIHGHCIHNESSDVRGGIGIYYDNNSLFNSSIPASQFETIVTDQRTELLAAIKTLRQVVTLSDSHGYIFDAVDIYTSSEYLSKGVNSWLQKWKKLNWKTQHGTSLANRDLWMQLDEFLLENFHRGKNTNDHGNPRVSAVLVSDEEIGPEIEEANKLAKAAAEMDGEIESSPPDFKTAFDADDHEEAVKRLKLGCTDGVKSPEAVKLKVHRAGLTSISMPYGFKLKLRKPEHQ